MSGKPLRLGVLISGSGTTLQNLIDFSLAGALKAEITVVVASRPQLMGTERAHRAGLLSFVVDRRAYTDCASFSREVFRHCDDAKVDLICCAGWLCLLEIPDRFHYRIINIHPALLPAFGGKGMFGHHVHEAVLAHGCKVSGCTVHFVDATYDTGPIIVQRTCPVMDQDTPQSLAARVFEEEKLALPEAINLFAENRLRVEGRRVHIARS